MLSSNVGQNDGTVIVDYVGSAGRIDRKRCYAGFSLKGSQFMRIVVMGVLSAVLAMAQVRAILPNLQHRSKLERHQFVDGRY
jgi:hypothetical protein